MRVPGAPGGFHADRLWSVVVKEVRQLRRERQLIPTLLIMPAIQLVLFGFAISTDLKGVNLGVVLEDPSPEARQMLAAVEATRAITITRSSANPADLEKWLDSGEVDVAMRIPRGLHAPRAAWPKTRRSMRCW